jgi:hypothetical protein
VQVRKNQENPSAEAASLSMAYLGGQAKIEVHLIDAAITSLSLSDGRELEPIAGCVR